MNIIDKLKVYPFPIIIFGASTAGEYVLNFCNKNNIKIECFCDNNLDKTKELFCEKKVKSIEDINKEYEEVQFLISTIDIKEVVDQLKKFKFINWLSCNEILKNIYNNVVSNMILSHDNYFNKDKLFIRGIDVIITEKCSLKCRDCSNLTQYYEKPNHCNEEEIFKEIFNFCSLVDKIGEVRIIGGEPFMNKNIHKIIKPLLSNEKINNVVIFTNGTMLPSKEQMKILKHNKVSFYISNYGKLSRKFNELCNLLNKENIPFIDAKFKWTDCGKINQHKRSKEENQKLFNDCCVKNLFTLSDNKLYRCPFHANADRLKAIPDFKKDYINLDLNKSKEKIKKFILNDNYLKVCDFCNGRGFNDFEIKAHIQIKKSLFYKKYEK